MRKRVGLFAVVLVSLVCGAVVLWGKVQPGADFSSVLQIWGDVLRDADEFGLQLTRGSDRDEMDLGRRMAQAMEGSWKEDRDAAQYLSSVAAELLLHVRRKHIRYEFHVVDSPQINAFALPGGQIFVMSGMLDFLQSEAELASILGHEISHVDLRHCIETYQYQLKLEKIGAAPLGRLVDLARLPMTMSYNKYQELDADAQGLRLSVEAGYDPQAPPLLWLRLERQLDEHGAGSAKTPAAELGQASLQALGSYLRSHPPSEERMTRLRTLAEAYRRRLDGRALYIGRENYRRRIAKSQQEFAGESTHF